MTRSDAPSQSRRANALGGKRWLQNSISVWSDIRKTPEEARLGHPAMFPAMLVERLIETFLPPGGELVLDPFAGSGSTLVAAERMGARAVGLELSSEYVELAQRRLDAPRAEQVSANGNGSETARGSGAPASGAPRRTGGQASGTPAASGTRASLTGALRAAVHRASAADVLQYVDAGSVDLCVTSPPYWDILNQRRTADLKAVRHYGNADGDLGTIGDYDRFLDALTDVFRAVLIALKPGAYCCVVVMDLRKKSRFYPLHSDLAGRLVEAGYVLDDLIIWNRQSEYNNLRPLGYPAVFRVNKVHEFVLLMQKPRAAPDRGSQGARIEDRG